MDSLIGDLATWAVDVMERLGYWGLALLVALENIFPPIPSEVILPLAGFLTSDGRMSFPLALLSATIGSVAGALVLYWVGSAFGEARVRSIVRRRGRWLRLGEEDVDLADAWFDRHGGLAVMLCRVVPIVRSLISIPAGLRRMPMAKFVLYTTIGSAAWNTILVGAGWILGDNWEAVEAYVGYLQYAVIAAVTALVAWWIWARFVKPGTPRP
ncbi:MAG: DedA family protein [Actinomycetota bacterium]|nr:DedA family protein [Actinomycetota bacterium]